MPFDLFALVNTIPSFGYCPKLWKAYTDFTLRSPRTSTIKTETQHLSHRHVQIEAAFYNSRKCCTLKFCGQNQSSPEF